MLLERLQYLRMRSNPPFWALAAPCLAVLQATGPAVRMFPADALAAGEGLL